MLFLTALLPILGIFIFLFFFKQTTLRAGIFSYVLTILITLLYPGFHLAPEHIMLSSIKGILIAFIAAYVLFFGIFLFHLMNSIGGIQSIAFSISQATNDRILQVMTLVIGLSPLLESTSGFGIAFMVVTPIFIALGFAPTKAILLGLVSLLAVPWGALATGTVIGGELIGEQLQNLGVGTAIISTPVFLYFLVIAVLIAGGGDALKSKWKEIILLSAIFSITIFFFNAFVSVELAGVLSSLITTGIGFVLMKLKKSHPVDSCDTRVITISLWKAVSPYIILTILIFLTRLVPPFREFLLSYGVISLPSISFSMALLYSPGFWLFITCILAIFIFKIPKNLIIQSFKKTIVHWVPFIISTSAFIGISEIMAEAGMTTLLANISASIFGASFFLISPFIGAIGGFLTGSNTGSNAMFIKLQAQTALQVGLSDEVISFAQNASSSHSTMASPARVALGTTLCGIKSQENKLLKSISLIVFGAILLIAFTLMCWILWIEK